jgi:hypothetical protein
MKASKVFCITWKSNKSGEELITTQSHRYDQQARAWVAVRFETHKCFLAVAASGVDLLASHAHGQQGEQPRNERGGSS